MTKVCKESENDKIYGEFLFRSVAVTKYNTKYYSENGYTKEDWTDYSDIGITFNRKVLLFSEYSEMETRYILACYVFIKHYVPKLKYITISLLEKYRLKLGDNDEGFNSIIKSIRKGKYIFLLTDLSLLVQLVLRNQAWFVIDLDDTHKIHFGYDYYMYFEYDRNILLNDKKFRNEIKKIGLFVR